MLEFASEWQGATYEILCIFLCVESTVRRWGRGLHVTKESRQGVENSAIICLPGSQWCSGSMFLQSSHRLTASWGSGILILAAWRPDKVCILSSAPQGRQSSVVVRSQFVDPACPGQISTGALAGCVPVSSSVKWDENVNPCQRVERIMATD